ncbi:MAG: choice-of-anchor J domain-containing protein [Bacteroidales bacterium]|nr:choice-of-anchor J domain-containing protein [Bacteroidales bacterium]MCF8456964.1 choice-of-anchor J domain-containing protein [Bacteroidales bacterium]
MKNLLIAFVLIALFSLSAQSQSQGEFHQKTKFPKKSLQAHPNKELSAKSLETTLENPSEINLNLSNQKPVRATVNRSKALGPKPQVMATGKGLNALKDLNKRPIKSLPASITSKSVEVGKVQTNNSNSLKSTSNVTILDQDFNTWPVSGWSMYSGTSSTATADGKWHQELGYTGVTGDNAAEILYNNGLMSDEWMVSPSMSLPSSSTIKLSFNWAGSYYWHVSPNDGADNPVLISTNGGTTWQTSPIWQEDNSAQVIASGVAWPWSDMTWYTSVVDISSFAGQSNVKFAFRYIGNDGDLWRIDNVEVYKVTSSTVTGDDCSTAIPLSGSLPITGTGTGINSFSNDYDNILTTPYGFLGPDMVYAYTATSTGLIDITIASDYDNLIALFTSCTSPGSTQIGVADNNWTAPFAETITISVVSGTTYYIVNGAYESTATGGWSYTIDGPCIDNLITVGSSEVEPNGGLNQIPTQYDARAVGTLASPTLITGNYFTVGDSIRDMDWFNFTITQEMIITGTVDVACTDPILYLVSDSVDALGDFLFYFDANSFGVGIGETLITTALPAGDYWLVVAPNTYAGINTPVNYNATLYGEATGSTLVGDDCSNAMALSGALPITGTGTGIENYSDQYSLILSTPSGYNSGDVVYVYTPTASGDITISFDCDFDNVIAVFTDCNSPALSQIASMDNNFNVPFFETLTITVTAGTTYYIVNGAYEITATGDWAYLIESAAPCVDNLVAIGVSEIEPNAGTNASPIEYDPRAVGTPLMPTLITGNYFTVGDSIRDMDWFNFTLTQEMTITATVDVDCTDPIIFILSEDTVYNSSTGQYELAYGVYADSNGPSSGETIVTTPLPAGNYWFIVAPNTFAGIPTPVNYNATLSGEATGTLQYYYFEDFQDGMPSDIILYNQDGLTPAANVSSYIYAWNIIENFDEPGDTVAASNSWYTPAGTANDWLVTPAIAIGSNAILEWDIKAQDPSYPDGYQVRISTTGSSIASFTTVLYSVAAANSFWETKTINLTALGYANQTIRIAFRNNSTDMFLLLLDDIKVFSPNATDVAIQDAYFTPLSDFSIIPLDQAGFTFGASAANVGSGALTNITFNLDVLGNSYAENATIASLAPGATSPVVISTPFTPTTADVYGFYYTMSVAGDVVLSNNEDLISIEISDTVLARDNGLPAGGVGFAGASGHFGNVFEIVNPTTLSSVSAYFNSAQTWETFSFTLFSNYNYTTNTVGLPMFTSPIFTKTNAMALNWNTFEVPSTSLVAGNYLLVVNQLDTTNISLGYDDDPNGFLVYYSSTPDSLISTNGFGNNCIRMNFEGASGSSPSWTYTNTGANHSILIPNTIPITMDGLPIASGDYIGVFFDQAGVETCGGYTEYTGTINSLSAWGAQSGLDDGFQAGEPFSWKIWDASTGIEYNATASYNTIAFPNSGTYVTNGLSGLASLIALTSETQTINLPSGWSIFSTYIDPFEANVDSVCSDISSQIVVAKNGDGLVYWPQYGLNVIGDMVIGEGYYIKCLSAQVLDVVGMSVDPLTTLISIQQGWSIMGYLHQTPANIASMMSSIVSDIVIMKNGNGQLYWPQWGLNGIGNMMPGEGYQINLLAAHTFSFPAITNPTSKSDKPTKAVHFNTEINTGNNMSFCFPASAWGAKIDLGDEIGAFDINNRLIGSAVYQGSNFALTAWGQDELELNGEGLLDGQTVSFRVWKNEKGEEYKLLIEDWMEGNDRYQKNGISVANSVGIIEQDQLFQNQPNPFSNGTKISFFVSEAGPVQIELYDILGNKLDVIFSEDIPAGEHSVWFNSADLSSGTYFYRMISQNLTTTRSLSIQK